MPSTSSSARKDSLSSPRKGSLSSPPQSTTPGKRLMRRTSGTIVHADDRFEANIMGISALGGTPPCADDENDHLHHGRSARAAAPAASPSGSSIKKQGLLSAVALFLVVSVGTLLNFSSTSPGPPPPPLGNMVIKHSVDCSVDGGACRVRFARSLGHSEDAADRPVDDDEFHVADLVIQHRSLFADDMIIEEHDGKERVITKDDIQHVLYETKPGTEQWGAAIMDAKTNKLVSGLFLTKDNQVIEHNIKATRHHRAGGGDAHGHLRRLDADETATTFAEQDEHVVMEMPGIGQPWLNVSSLSSTSELTEDVPNAVMMANNNDNHNGDGDDLRNVGETVLVASAGSGLVRFYPGCFKGDAATQVFKMNVAYDYGLASTFSSTAAALADVDVLFSAGKLVFLSQLNIRLELGKVTLGAANSEVPLNRGAGGNKCVTALGALPEMAAWAKKQTRTGFTLLMSNCFSGVTGTSYIGGACSVQYNANVAAHSWIIAFHELGHAFGMSHSFENGVGNTGGLMDYGDGKYNGVYQFHPNKKREVCPFLTYTVPRCPYFSTSDAASSCGDGILSKGETCECVQQGKTSCGNCRNCQATASVECSSKDFVFRTPGMPATVVVSNVDYLADPECCTANNKLAPAKTLCGRNKLNACSVGKCKAVCTKYLSANNPNCGFDNTGCMLGCVNSNMCRFDLAYNDQVSNKRVFVSELTAGTKCVTANGRSGTCANRVCVAGSAGAGVANDRVPATTKAPSKRPTVKPPTTKPTKKKTALGAAPPAQCAKHKRAVCIKAAACTWTKSKCRAKAAAARLVMVGGDGGNVEEQEEAAGDYYGEDSVEGEEEYETVVDVEAAVEDAE